MISTMGVVKHRLPELLELEALIAQAGDKVNVEVIERIALDKYSLPIYCLQLGNNDINARFIKEQKCIELDYYGPYGNWTYNCRSVDLIAHETGHAILDSILPYLNEGNAETRGIGEAFCDLTSMFWILSQEDMCQIVLKEQDGDLTRSNILTLFGAGYGYKENELRNSETH